MTATISRFVSLAITTIDTAAIIRGSPLTSPVAAIGMLAAERDAEDRWTFSLSGHAIGAGDREDQLFTWAAAAMPATGIAIGWQLADAVVTPLLEASKHIEPEIARDFVDCLTTLVTTPSVDLAIAHGGAAAPPFAEVAAGCGINVTPLSNAEIESAWAFGDVDALTTDVAQRAVATLRLWLAESNDAGAAALAAFEAWLLEP